MLRGGYVRPYRERLLRRGGPSGLPSTWARRCARWPAPTTSFGLSWHEPLLMRRWPRGSDGAWRTPGRSRTPCRTLPPTSLNQPLTSDKGSSELGELVEDERSSDTPGTVMSEMESSQLGEAIDRLPERYRYVLVRRYGIDNKDPATLAELSDELGLSRERIRQLQLKAVHMLKSGEFGCALRAAYSGGSREV